MTVDTSSVLLLKGNIENWPSKEGASGIFSSLSIPETRFHSRTRILIFFCDVFMSLCFHSTWATYVASPIHSCISLPSFSSSFTLSSSSVDSLSFSCFNRSENRKRETCVCGKCNAWRKAGKKIESKCFIRPRPLNERYEGQYPNAAPPAPNTVQTPPPVPWH
jgi:hypothetical protein